MYVTTGKLDLPALERIAASVEVRLSNARHERTRRDGREIFGLVLRTAAVMHPSGWAERPARPAPRWRRVSRPYGNPPGKRKDGTRTVPGVVCWHGHYAFMEALLEADPEAWIETSRLTGRIRYEGVDDFHERAGATANTPYQRDPDGRERSYGETCECVQPTPPPKREAANREIMTAFIERTRQEWAPE